jgi:hypothetical protein
LHDAILDVTFAVLMRHLCKLDGDGGTILRCRCFTLCRCTISLELEGDGGGAGASLCADAPFLSYWMEMAVQVLQFAVQVLQFAVQVLQFTVV